MAVARGVIVSKRVGERSVIGAESQMEGLTAEPWIEWLLFH